MKKIIITFFAMSIALIAKAEGVQVGELFYNLNELEKTAEIISSGWNANYVGISSVIVPDNINYNGDIYDVTSIGVGAFSQCTSLTSITIGNHVSNIGNMAFDRCTSLTSITIGSHVSNIGSWAFANCSSLTSITIPNSVTSIERSAFENCSSLTSIVIPNSVTNVGERAFAFCSSLTSVTISNNLASIQNLVFYQCSSLTSVTIPENITSINSDAFEGCSSLTSITWNAKNCSDFSESKAAPFYYCLRIASFTFGNSVEYIPAYLCCRMSNLSSITIPNCVTSIGVGAFSDCTSLTSITIPNSVTSIGVGAFRNCTSLTSITIGSHVSNIGNGAFANCSSLTSVTIPNSVTSIGFEAFYGCSSLTSITIPNSVTSIGQKVFSSCPAITSIIVESGNTRYDSRDDCNAIILTASNILVEGCQNTTIPNTVTSIGRYAFSGCSTLTSITIPENITIIPNDAFENCSSLTSITWNAKNCSDFPSIGFAPFFDIRTQITSFIFGDSVEYIPAYLCCAMNNLTSVSIPNCITSIGNSAFFACSSLSSIIIPNDVTSIGEHAFQDCHSLNTIYCYAVNSPTIWNTTFTNYEATLYVPCEALEDYQQHEIWGQFKNIQCISSENTSIDNTISCGKKTNKLLHNGQLIILSEDKSYTITGQEL